VQRCLEEFDYLAKEFTSKYICILDNTFVANPKRLRDFCRGLIKKYKGRMQWFCEARVDTLVRHPDLLPLMIEAGLIRLQVGGESGSQPILDIYKKGTTLDQIEAVTESARVNGLLSLYVNFIIGGAYETQRTYEQTRDFALRLLERAPGCATVGNSFYTPYPGTEMYENPKEFGIEVMDQEVVTGMGDQYVFCRTQELSRFDILALGRDFIKSVKEKMQTLCRQLPQEIIERHFRAFYEWNLSSEWYEALSNNIAIFGYYRSIFRTGAKTFAEASAQTFQDMYPRRTIELVTTKGNNFLIRMPNGVIREMDELESIVLEFSAGKLSFNDIIEIISSRMPELNAAKIREAIVERYANCDKEYLIVWKTDT
jgi:radical SAM superfamily enzyme YgiQ (UPF0313 family)